jgi:hypothetical protein
LLLDYLLQACPNVPYDYRVTVPRTPAEAAFLPAPPDVAPERVAPVPLAQVVRRQAWQSAWAWPLLAAMFPAFVAAVLGFGRQQNNRLDREYRLAGRQVVGQLYRDADQWRARYTAEGASRTVEVYRGQELPAGLREGDAVELRYCLDWPDGALTADQFPLNKLPWKLELGLWMFVLLMLPLSVLLYRHGRRHRQTWTTEPGPEGR